MKKLILSCLVLAMAVILVPQSQGATAYCISLTNFCDQISLTSNNVGGVQGVLLAGAWDWECLGDFSSSTIAGTPPAAKTYLATRPVYSGTNYAFAYTAMFSLKKSGSVFDLYGVGFSVLPFQVDQGWSFSNGACRQRKSSRPPALR